VLDPGGIPIATTSSEEVAPAVAFDGRNFLVVWSPSTGSVLGARVSTGGTVLDRSALVITADTSAWRPAIAFTGASYLVAWQGGNGSSSWDIVGTRVSTHGKVLDPAGIAISSAPNAQERPAIAFDGSNSLVVWEDGRSSPRGDIYAARVTPTGNVLDPFGIPVSTAPDWQREPTVAANGGFLVVWRDDRRQGLPADASDIFGTRVGSNGAVLDASGFAITDSNDLESEPAVAIGLRNSWEVAYRRFAPERIYGADRVFHRTVTN
jgi:hypothetical protein